MTAPLRVQYSAQKFVIDKTSIKDFYIYEDERRQLRIGKVASLRVQFSNEDKLEKHFDAPFIVNKHDNEHKYRAIDCNHRIEAIKEKLAIDPKFSIEVWLFVYKNLTREQERLIYTKWQRGSSQSATDFIANHHTTISLMPKILEMLPVSIYPSERKMAVKLAVGSYIATKSNHRFKGGYGAGGEKTVADFRELTIDDIKIVKAFLKDMEEIFGAYFKGNPWYMSTPYSAFYKIWYDNRSIPREKFIKIFRKVFAERLVQWSMQIKSGGREASMMFYNLAVMSLRDRSKTVSWKADIPTLSVKEPDEEIENNDELT
jgi:hypothetical protein